ncbi:MAG TPA: formate dehydrogenase accessory sulfurtransferase FdhD [Proteobacteria bacterium]|nr:formate dehydrogenase accessory sulfurtransferase FdhD [Pseudomonadota bacterium]
MNLYRCSAIRVNKDKVAKIKDNICIEDTFRLYLNDEPLVELIASPGQLKELGAGFVVCEGLAQGVDNVHVSGNEIRVSAKTSGKFEKELRSGGGFGIRRTPRKVTSSLVIRKEDVFRVISEMESEIWKKTGGVHCSVLFSNKNLGVKSSDVGRHNTIDKVIGFAILNNIDLSTCIIGCTGRQPAGMISKNANAGVPIIISKAAPTDKGISTAVEAGITLICFARDGRFTVYTHPYRVYEIAEVI